VPPDLATIDQEHVSRVGCRPHTDGHLSLRCAQPFLQRECAAPRPDRYVVPGEGVQVDPEPIHLYRVDIDDRPIVRDVCEPRVLRAGFRRRRRRE